MKPKRKASRIRKSKSNARTSKHQRAFVMQIAPSAHANPALNNPQSLGKSESWSKAPFLLALWKRYHKSPVEIPTLINVVVMLFDFFSLKSHPCKAAVDVSFFYSWWLFKAKSAVSWQHSSALIVSSTRWIIRPKSTMSIHNDVSASFHAGD